jgi:hypothetical protein
MTEQALPLMFLASGLMTAGLLALVIGFFIGLLNPKEKFELATAVFLSGVVAVVIGAWLMRVVPS